MGKEFTIRTGKTSTISGVIESCEADTARGVFKVVLLQSGKYRFGPYYVKKVPN